MSSKRDEQEITFGLTLYTQTRLTHVMNLVLPPIFSNGNKFCVFLPAYTTKPFQNEEKGGGRGMQINVVLLLS